MADPLSLTASLLAVATAAIATSKTVFRVGNTIIRAQRQINDLAQGLVHFNSILRTLSRVIAIAPDALNHDGVDDAKRVCRNCSNIVREIRRVFRKLEKDDLTIIERIKWIFKQDSLRFPKARLESAKTDLMLIIEILNLSINLKQANSWKNEALQQQYETIKLNIAASFANDVELGSSELVEEEEESPTDASTTNVQPCTSLVRIQDTRDQGHFAGLCLEQSLSVTHALDKSGVSIGKEVSQNVYRRMEDYTADLVPLLLQRWTTTNVSNELKTAITKWDEDEEVITQAEPTWDPRDPETTRHTSTRFTPTKPKGSDNSKDMPHRFRFRSSTNSGRQDDEAPDPKGAPQNTLGSPLLADIQDLVLNPRISRHGLKVESYQDQDIPGHMAVSSYSKFSWPSNEAAPKDAFLKPCMMACIHMTPWDCSYTRREGSPTLLFNLNLRSFLKGRVKGRSINALVDKFSWFGATTAECLYWNDQYENGNYTPGVATMIAGFWVFMMTHLSAMITEDHDVLDKLLHVYVATIRSRKFALFEAEAEVDHRGQLVHPNNPEANRIIVGLHDWDDYVERVKDIKQGVVNRRLKRVPYNRGLQLPNYRYVQVCPQSPEYFNGRGYTETVRAVRAGQSR